MSLSVVTESPDSAIGIEVGGSAGMTVPAVVDDECVDSVEIPGVVLSTDSLDDVTRTLFSVNGALVSSMRG